MKEVDQEGYKYLGILQLDKTMNKEMKENNGNEYIRGVKFICKLILNAGNFIWLEYLGYRCVGTVEEFQIVQKRNFRTWTGKLERCFYPRSSVARLYMKWKEGGRGLISVEDCITTERR